MVRSRCPMKLGTLALHFFFVVIGAWSRVSEILAVATAEGVDLDFGEVTDHAMSTYRSVGDHWASMAVDVKERRRTEIDSLCGEVSARGRRHEIPTPVNDAIGNLILAVENGHLELAAELLAAGADANDDRRGFTPLHAITWVRKPLRGDGDRLSLRSDI